MAEKTKKNDATIIINEYMYRIKFVKDLFVLRFTLSFDIHRQGKKIFLNLFPWPRKNIFLRNLISPIRSKNVFRGDLISPVIPFNRKNAKFSSRENFFFIVMNLSIQFKIFETSNFCKIRTSKLFKIH